MVTLTHDAADAIRQLTEAPEADGVRLHAGPRFSRGDAPQVQIEVAERPGVEDTVLEAAGARLYLEPETMRALDHKVIDADVEDGEPHFTIFEQMDVPETR